MRRSQVQGGKGGGLERSGIETEIFKRFSERTGKLLHGGPGRGRVDGSCVAEGLHSEGLVLCGAASDL